MVRMLKYDKNGIGFWLWQVSIYLFLLKLVSADGDSWVWPGAHRLEKERFYLSDQKAPAKCKDPYYDYEEDNQREDEALDEVKRGKRDECSCVKTFQKTFPPSCGTTCACSCSPTCLCSGLPLPGVEGGDVGRPRREPDCPECTSASCMPPLKCCPPKCDVKAQPTCPQLCLTPCPCPCPPKPCCPKVSEQALAQRLKKGCDCMCPTTVVCPTKCFTCRPPCCIQNRETPPECPATRASCRPTCCPPPKPPCCPLKETAVNSLIELTRKKKSFKKLSRLESRKIACTTACTTKDPCGKSTINPCCDPGPDNPDCPCPPQKKPGKQKCTTKDPCAPKCTTEDPCGTTTGCTTKDPCAPSCPTENPCGSTKATCPTEDPCGTTKNPCSSSEACCFRDENRKRLAKRDLDFIVALLKRRAAFEQLKRHHRVKRQCGPTPCPTLGTTCRHTTTDRPLICPTNPPPSCMSTCKRTTLSPPKTCPPTCPNPCDVPKKPCEMLKGAKSKTNSPRGFFRFKRECPTQSPPKCACPGQGVTCCPTTVWNDNKFWPPTRPLRLVEHGIPIEEISAPWMEELDSGTNKENMPYSDYFLYDGGNYVGHRFKRDDPAIDRIRRGGSDNKCSLCTCTTKPCPNCTTCPYPCNTVKLVPEEDLERIKRATCEPPSCCPPVGCKVTCCVTCRPRPCVSCPTCSVKRRRSAVKKVPYPLNILDFPMERKRLNDRREKRQPVGDMISSFHQIFMFPSKKNISRTKSNLDGYAALRPGRRANIRTAERLSRPEKRGCDPCEGKATCPCVPPTDKTCPTTTCPLSCEKRSRKRHVLISERDWVAENGDLNLRDRRLANFLDSNFLNELKKRKSRMAGLYNVLGKRECAPPTHASCSVPCATKPTVPCCPTLPTCPPPSCRTCKPECPAKCRLRPERECCSTSTKSCTTKCATEEPPVMCASTCPATCSKTCQPTTCPVTKPCKRSLGIEPESQERIPLEWDEDMTGNAIRVKRACKTTCPTKPPKTCSTTCKTTRSSCEKRKRDATISCPTFAITTPSSTTCPPTTCCPDGKPLQVSRLTRDSTERGNWDASRERRCGCPTTKPTCSTASTACCGGGGGGGPKQVSVEATERHKRAAEFYPYDQEDPLPPSVQEEVEQSQIS